MIGTGWESCSPEFPLLVNAVLHLPRQLYLFSTSFILYSVFHDIANQWQQLHLRVSLTAETGLGFLEDSGDVCSFFRQQAILVTSYGIFFLFQALHTHEIPRDNVGRLATLMHGRASSLLLPNYLRAFGAYLRLSNNGFSQAHMISTCAIECASR